MAGGDRSPPGRAKPANRSALPGRRGELGGDADEDEDEDEDKDDDENDDGDDGAAGASWEPIPPAAADGIRQLGGKGMEISSRSLVSPN